MSDYIKREDALKSICYDCNTRLDCKKNPCADYARLRDMPAADARENVRSKWVDMDADEYYDTIILRCGNCGDSTEFFWYGTPSELMKIMRFCPRCGAVMEGGDDE